MVVLVVVVVVLEILEVVDNVEYHAQHDTACIINTADDNYE